MITYNHEKFIAQAIESVLMQETSFPVELVIGEDCSTDGTRQIVRAFAQLHPHIIRPLLPEGNVGMHRNLQSVLQACRGEYIAFLEGDDYWTSPQKLQKQADFMDSHPDFSICGHRIIEFYQDHPEKGSYPSPVQKESGTLEDILRADYLPSCSVVYRAGLAGKPPPSFADLLGGDWSLWVLLAERGRIGFINEIMAHYRVHSGGVWMGISLEAKLASVEKTLKTIHAYVGNRYPSIHRLGLLDNNLLGAREYKWRGLYGKACFRLLRALACHPLGFVRSGEARQLVRDLARHYFVKNGTQRLMSAYYRARIRAGAKRREVWSAFRQGRT